MNITTLTKMEQIKIGEELKKQQKVYCLQNYLSIEPNGDICKCNGNCCDLAVANIYNENIDISNKPSVVICTDPKDLICTYCKNNAISDSLIELLEFYKKIT